MTPRPQVQPHKCACTVCFDRLLPKNLLRFNPNVETYSGRVRAISPIGRSWLNGSTLQVRFLGGTDAQRELVKIQAGWWTLYANIKFDFNQSPQADIRISFNPADGAWSYIGTDCKSIPQDQPNINLGFDQGGTYAHEIGHCLSGDTLIDCPRDLEQFPLGIPIKDLVGQTPWVYAWKDGAIVVRKASMVWLTKRAETVRVKLRPGKGKKHTAKYFPPQELIGTEDHHVLLSDGKTWRRLGELQPGDRLCSLYRYKNRDRSNLKWTGGPRNIMEHVLVCESLYGPRPERHDSHHINHRKLDQRPDNLQWKDESTHMSEHALGRPMSLAARSKLSKTLKYLYSSGARVPQFGKPCSEATRAKLSAAFKGRPLSPEHCAKIAAARVGFRYSDESRAKMSSSAKARSDQVRNESGRFLPATNHVVVSVEPAGVRDVFDMTVPDADNFVANGIVVHNSLGLLHEHQNPLGGIQWNRDQVIKDLSGPPNFWDISTTEHNVFEKYKSDQINGSEFDPQSIMLYAFPASWTLNGFEARSNDVLSEMDRAFIASERMYPKDKPTIVDAVELLVDAPQRTKASIGAFGEVDLFTFTVTTPGRFLIDTFGYTDTILRIFGPQSATALIAENDDGGWYLSSRVNIDLIAGRYYADVRHFNKAKGTGTYSIRVATV